MKTFINIIQNVFGLYVTMLQCVTLFFIGGSVTDNLHFAKLPIIGSRNCQQMYDTFNQQNNKGIRIFEGQICAGYAEGRTDGCQVVKPGGQYYQNYLKL